MLIYRPGDCQYIRNSIRNLVYNAVGTPEVHQRQQWVFDPDAGRRRSVQYQQINGRLGELAIERLGLGIDGRESERIQQQRLRDEGHLGGLNAYLP